MSMFWTAVVKHLFFCFFLFKLVIRFSMFLSNGVPCFPPFMDIVGVISQLFFQVVLDCKYGDALNTCDNTFLVSEPTSGVMLSCVHLQLMDFGIRFTSTMGSKQVWIPQSCTMIYVGM